MDFSKIIVLCCIVFVVALITYIIVKKKDEIKAYILKIDEKITKHNEKVTNNKKEIKQKDASQEEDKNKTEENSSKKVIKPQAQAKAKAASFNAKDGKELESSNKLKPSKAVEQIRPVLLPPNREAEERDVKLLEMSKRPEMLGTSPQKALDFKYGSSKMAMQQNVNESPFVSEQRQRTIQNSYAAPRPKNNSNNFISFDKESDNFNPLKRDVKKQFDDIKNFLELPENQSTIQNKGVSYNGKSFNTVNKIDASIFNSPESHYVDYRNTPMQPRTNSTVINSVNNAMQKNFISLPPKFQQTNNTSNVMVTNTKYSRNPSTQYGMPSFNVSEREQQEASRYNQDFTLTKEQEDIDLNKLPNNLKKMIIQNILDRKNYD